jgi:LysM repeat protein
LEEQVETMANYTSHTGPIWDPASSGTIRLGGVLVAAVGILMWMMAYNVLTQGETAAPVASEPAWAAQPIADTDTLVPLSSLSDREAATAAPAEASEPAAAASSPASPTTTEGSDSVYVVVAGDTMARIAQRHGVTLSALLAANPTITDPARIEIGQRINLP